MTYPQWLDPTPLTRAFVGSFANIVPREPFIHQRRQLKTGETFKRAAQISNAARKQALLDELALSGETLKERNTRKRAEWKRAQRAKYWADRKAGIGGK